MSASLVHYHGTEVLYVESSTWIDHVDTLTPLRTVVTEGSRIAIYIGGRLVWHRVINVRRDRVTYHYDIRREAEWPAPDPATRTILKPCAWAGCTKLARHWHGYWGEYHWLCDEHGDLVGDDGSMNEPPL